MKILITGAEGFVGRNLAAALTNLRDGKDRTRPELAVEEVFCFDQGNTDEELERFCAAADFVFHLAGVNRPVDPREFITGNVDLTDRLLGMLKKHGNRCPVMLASSVQASLTGRYAGSLYGQSKREGETLMFRFGAETGAPVLVYRFPNLFGKWCRPNYNSVVATFCHNIARDLPIRVDDPAAELELAYIDDVVDALLCALAGNPHREGDYCAVPVTHRQTLGQIVALLRQFRAMPDTGMMPELPAGSFAKKLYSTYLSYLPPEKVCYPLTMHTDARGSFTELLRTGKTGQFSVNISRPGITKGQHWHHSKWELFIVVSGHGRIEERNLRTGEVIRFDVSGERIEAVHMLPGWTHNIINLSDTEDLVTLMWANECFDPSHPDTFSEPV